jgi:hypothetical protein
MSTTRGSVTRSIMVKEDGDGDRKAKELSFGQVISDFV